MEKMKEKKPAAGKSKPAKKENIEMSATPVFRDRGDVAKGGSSSKSKTKLT